jgi:Fe2+ or Zn2+ uptake regulation protein
VSQEEIIIILKELGGEATTKEIKSRAKEKFPDLTLYHYVFDRLKKLEKWGYVKGIKTDNETSWELLKENYP